MKNFELKVRRRNLARDRATCRDLGAEFVARLTQRDTYFTVPRGRFKLREQDNGAAWLIAYVRPDARKARLCDYVLLPVAEPRQTRRLLAACMGTLAEVRKVRELFLAGGVRIHLDRVRGLGTFLEFEAVLEPGRTTSWAKKALARLSAAFALRPSDAVAGSYLDCILARKT